MPKHLGFALIANTLHGIPEPDRKDLIHKVHEVLRPQGLFAIINWHPMPREQTPVLDEPRGLPTQMRMSLEQTRTVAEPWVGLYLERVVEFPPYHCSAVFVRN